MWCICNQQEEWNTIIRKRLANYRTLSIFPGIEEKMNKMTVFLEAATSAKNIYPTEQYQQASKYEQEWATISNHELDWVAINEHSEF